MVAEKVIDCDEINEEEEKLSSEEEMNEVLRHYGVWKIIDVVYTIIVCLIMAVRGVLNVSEKLVLGMISWVIIL